MAQINDGQIRLQVNLLLTDCDEIFEDVGGGELNFTVPDEEIAEFIAEEMQNAGDIESIVIAGHEYSVSKNPRYSVTKVSASA